MLYELRVLSGLNSGALLPLTGTQWLIGSSPDADMVLYDAAIAQNHCQLRATDNGWQVEALQGAVLTNEGRRVEQIDSLEPGTPFSLAGIWLCVAQSDTPWETESAPAAQADSQTGSHAPVAERPRRRLNKAVAAVCFFFAIGAFGLGGFSGKDERPEDISMPVPKPQKTFLESAAQTREMLASLLQQAGLGQRVDLEITGSDDIILHLVGDDKLQAETQALLQQFDRRYQSAAQISLDIVQPPPPLPFRIALVVKGESPYIVTDKGLRVFINDEINGIKLLAINEEKLIFQGETRFEVPW